MCRNILLHPTIRATMTDTMLKREEERGLYPKKIMVLVNNCVNQPHDLDIHQQVNNNQLNFNNGGMAQYVANSIIGEVDKQEARDRILSSKTAAKSTRDRIMSITKKMTAGKLLLEGRSFTLDKNALEQAEERHKLQGKQRIDKIKKPILPILNFVEKQAKRCSVTDCLEILVNGKTVGTY